MRALLETDGPVERMFLNDEFEVWAVGDDLVAKFPRTEIDAAKVPVEAALHPTIRGLLGDVVPAIRMVGTMGDAGRRFIVHERATGSQGQTVDGASTVSAADGLSASHRTTCSAHSIGSAAHEHTISAPVNARCRSWCSRSARSHSLRRRISRGTRSGASFLALPPGPPTAERCAIPTSRANTSSSTGAAQRDRDHRLGGRRGVRPGEGLRGPGRSGSGRRSREPASKPVKRTTQRSPSARSGCRGPACSTIWDACWRESNVRRSR